MAGGTTLPRQMAVVFTAKATGNKDLMSWLTKAIENAGLVVSMDPASPVAPLSLPDSSEALAEASSIGLVSATMAAAQQAAEVIKLRMQRTGGGRPVPFTVREVSSFPRNPLFSQAEEILLLNYLLDQVKADQTLFEDVKSGESVLKWCCRQGYVQAVFPLHDEKASEDIRASLSVFKPWFDEKGLEKIRDYFGDKIALYFGFLGFYTKAVMGLAAAGLCVTFLRAIGPGMNHFWSMLYSLFVCVWGVSVISLWRKRNVDISFNWRHLVPGDTSDEKILQQSLVEEEREDFCGEMVLDRISGLQVKEAKQADIIKNGTISGIVVFVLLVIAIVVLRMALDFQDINQYWIDNKANNYLFTRNSIVQTLLLSNLPLVVYMVCLTALNSVYTAVATMLTTRENHKYDYQYENAMVFKMVLWNFFYLNMSYLYLAFIRRDVPRVASGLKMIMAIEAIVGNVKENAIPIIKRKMAEKKPKDNGDKVAPKSQAMEEMTWDESDEVFGDYVELLKQFTQITVFATAFPLGAVLAAINNLIEISSDTYKYCKNQRRIIPRRAISIGSWIYGFELLSILAITSNIGMMIITSAEESQHQNRYHEIVFLFVMEHILLAVRAVIQHFLGAVPSKVRDIRAREKLEAEYTSLAQHTK